MGLQPFQASLWQPLPGHRKPAPDPGGGLWGYGETENGTENEAVTENDMKIEDMEIETKNRKEGES